MPTVEFMVATDNIRATPPMLASNVAKCIHRSVRWGDWVDGGKDSAERVTVVGYHEMGHRRLSDLLAPYPDWHSLQGPVGDKARSAIGWDHRVWRVRHGSLQQIKMSSDHTTAGVYVPSGNRYAIEAVLEDRATDIPVVFIALHTVAHVNVGDHFGYTGKGPLSLLHYRLLGKPNPAIETYQQAMKGLEKRVMFWRAQDMRVVVLGDWNFDAWNDLRSAHPQTFAPRRTMERCQVETIYSGGHIKEVKGGPRIDYIGITHHESGAAKLVSADWIDNSPSDHPLVRARIRITK